MFVAILSAFILPDLPHNSRGFTEEELQVAQLRMVEDVGEADVDEEGQGIFDGLWMALRDAKIYLMMLTFTAYVVGLSFNAFFVRNPPLSPCLLFLVFFPRAELDKIANEWRWCVCVCSFAADAHGDARFRLRRHAADVLAPLGLRVHRFADQRVARRPDAREGE